MKPPTGIGKNAVPDGARLGADDAGVVPSEPHSPLNRYMSVRQTAQYLQINEKKVYTLASEGRIPGTKITGKWLFPRDLVDQWLLESSHGGVLTDRLVLAGSDDPLLHRVVAGIAQELQAKALVNYTCTGTQTGLSLLAARRIDVCAIHWGPASESHLRHPALLMHHPQHHQWALVRAFQREQGLIVSPSLSRTDMTISDIVRKPLRWIFRQEGAGSQRFFQETAVGLNLDISRLQVARRTHSERETASFIATDRGDIGPGVRSAAQEFGLGFVPIGWEAFDFVLYRPIYFRTLFHRLLETLKSPPAQAVAESLGGYEFGDLGRLVWSG